MSQAEYIAAKMIGSRVVSKVPDSLRRRIKKVEGLLQRYHEGEARIYSTQVIAVIVEQWQRDFPMKGKK